MVFNHVNIGEIRPFVHSNPTGIQTQRGLTKLNMGKVTLIIITGKNTIFVRVKAVIHYILYKSSDSVKNSIKDMIYYVDLFCEF